MSMNLGISPVAPQRLHHLCPPAATSSCPCCTNSTCADVTRDAEMTQGRRLDSRWSIPCPYNPRGIVSSLPKEKRKAQGSDRRLGFVRWFTGLWTLSCSHWLCKGTPRDTVSIHSEVSHGIVQLDSYQLPHSTRGANEKVGINETKGLGEEA